MLNNMFKVSLLYIIVIILVVPFHANAVQEDDMSGKDGDSINEDTGKENSESKRRYLYDPTGKTDPFKSFITLRQEKADKEKEEPRTVLETLELSQLKLSAIIISDKGKWAMVTDSKDVGHIIKEGTPIGTNGGKIYKIKPGEVIIREEYINFRGEKQYKDVLKKSPSVK